MHSWRGSRLLSVPRSLESALEDARGPDFGRKPDSGVEFGLELTDADREALRAALAGLVPVAVQDLAGPTTTPTGTLTRTQDAAQRAE